MSTYVTWWLVEVPSKGIFHICKTDEERDKTLHGLFRRCTDDEQWRVDKPAITVRMDRHTKGAVMRGRY